VKVGDLVRIIRYGSRFAPDGSMGIITKKLPMAEPKSLHHQCYEIRFDKGGVGRHADFCLEVISEA